MAGDLDASCGYYNEDTQEWMTEGVAVYSTSAADGTRAVTCSTTHLSDFTLTFDPTPAQQRLIQDVTDTDLAA